MIHGFPLILSAMLSLAPDAAAAAPGTVAAVEARDPAEHAAETLAKDYLVAWRRAFDAGATGEDIDRLAAFFAEDGVVEHPRAGARVEGRDAIRRGLASHVGDYVGEGRIQVADIRSTPRAVVVDLTLTFNVPGDDGPRAVTGRHIKVIELADGRIARVIDYW